MDKNTRATMTEIIRDLRTWNVNVKEQTNTNCSCKVADFEHREEIHFLPLCEMYIHTYVYLYSYTVPQLD